MVLCNQKRVRETKYRDVEKKVSWGHYNSIVLKLPKRSDTKSTGDRKMKWRTHIAISKVIGKSLDLPKDLEKALIQGAIEPDKYRSKYISHHHAYSSLVMRYLTFLR